MPVLICEVWTVQQITIREIAANANISYVTFFRHHPTKEALLHDIAQEEAIRMESLLEYNHLQSYMQPAAGEQLYLKSKAPAMPRLAKSELAAAGR